MNNIHHFICFPAKNIQNFQLFPLDFSNLNDPYINSKGFFHPPNFFFNKENNIGNNDNNNKKIWVEPFSEINQKRGRKNQKLYHNKKAIHGSSDFDNIQRKIQVHFLTFLIDFCNDALKSEYIHSNYSFKQINYKDKTTINQVYTSFLKRSSIKDILKFEISDKYKRYNKNSNKELLEKVISSSTFLNNLFEMKYIKLFNYYYNKEEPLKKIIFENKEIILSPKTKSFYELLEKNKNNELREEIIKAVKSIYFNGCDSNNNHFSTIIFSCS